MSNKITDDAMQHIKQYPGYEMLSEESRKNLVDPLGFEPLIKGDVQFINLGPKSHKDVDFNFKLNPDNRSVSYSSRSGAKGIEFFRDPKTGLFHTKTNEERNGAYRAKRTPTDLFTSTISNLLYDAWRQKYRLLERLRKNDPDKYDEQYRDLAVLDRKMSKKVQDHAVVYEKLLKNFKLLQLREEPPFNERLIFKDTIINRDVVATTRLDYYDPHFRKATDKQRERVVKFLRVFMNDDNIKVFLWFFGAVLNNEDTRKISKMLVVSSAKGGNGKTTLMESILHALMNNFYETMPSLDPVFSFQNRFATAVLHPFHVNMFDEAEWSQQPTDENHDLSGYDLDSLKSIISNGRYMTESKFEKPQKRESPYMFTITLTNHFPVISQDKEALNRRLLPLVLLPSTMDDKGNELGMHDRQEIFAYTYEYRQDFADVCYDYYSHNKDEFVHSKYNHVEAVNDILKQQNNYQKQKQKQTEELKQLATIDPVDALHKLSKQSGIDFDKLASLLTPESLKAATEANFKWSNIFRTEKVNGKYIVYIDSTKKTMLSLTGQAQARDVFVNTFGKPIKKFNRRMFKLG